MISHAVLWSAVTVSPIIEVKHPLSEQKLYIQKILFLRVLNAIQYHSLLFTILPRCGLVYRT
jgi:hypothetical protein